MTHPIDTLVSQAVFGNETEKQTARFSIWQQGVDAGIIPSSIHKLYIARAEGKIEKTFTVPAMNIRVMTYDTARAAFAAAKKLQVGAMIFEIARSEMAYTDQSPQEYVSVLTAAALREEWSGPLFVQGDHFQAKASQTGIAKEGEIEKIEKLAVEAIAAGFYNIDIDMSTLVDLAQPTEAQQQIPNFTHSAHLVQFIRSQEPADITISLGGEIGHIGGKNSTLEDFDAFMEGFLSLIPADMPGISKISAQTGTSHGGVVLADGSLAEVKVDFSLLQKISERGREKYHMGGSVQHGASTLPDNLFGQFPLFKTLEVHLATGFQNLLLNDPHFPQEILQEVYTYLDTTLTAEKSPDHTPEQFHYSLRKKAIGPFKKRFWDIDETTKQELRNMLQNKFAFFFQTLGVDNTQELVKNIVQPVVINKTLADFALTPKIEKPDDSRGLSD